MRWISSFVLLAIVSVSSAADLTKLPGNTWVEIEYTTRQPSSHRDEQGRFGAQGWNKLVYDADGQRVLFYDRWIDTRHGGWTIYGNCLFAFDPARGVLTPVKIDNWTKIDTKEGGYRTRALPENEAEPTPAPRHVYHCFEYVSARKAVFLCNGANQSVIDKNGKLVGHDACDGAWRLDLGSNRWSRIHAEQCPANMLDDAMAYCPDIQAMVLHSGSNRQLWIWDLAAGQFRKARQSPPRRSAAGATIVYDPTQRRMLIAGGGPLEGPFNQARSAVFRVVYAFDPRTETIKKLAGCPIPLYEGHLAFDTKNQLFFTAANFWKADHPTGIFAYDPSKDAWKAVRSNNPPPASNNWFSWVQLCYDAHHGCLIAKVREKWYAFRYVAGS
jgi:hypothetical protein